MGFRTLRIEKRSSEVWRLREGVKSEFGKFGVIVDRVNNSLTTAKNHIESLRQRSRVLSKSLRDVESLPEPDAKLLLKLASPTGVLVDSEDEGAVSAVNREEPEATA